jgi:hypothetical protein
VRPIFTRRQRTFLLVIVAKKNYKNYKEIFLQLLRLQFFKNKPRKIFLQLLKKSFSAMYANNKNFCLQLNIKLNVLKLYWERNARILIYLLISDC